MISGRQSSVSAYVLFALCYLDSRMSRVGEDFPRHLPSTPTMLGKLLGKSELTYVLSDSKFQEEGYLAVLEFIVAQPGPIRIQVGVILFVWFYENGNF